MMVELGHEPTAAGVAALFADLLDLYLIDPLDAHLGPAIRAGGAQPVVTPALMRGRRARPAWRARSWARPVCERRH